MVRFAWLKAEIPHTVAVPFPVSLGVVGSPIHYTDRYAAEFNVLPLSGDVLKVRRWYRGSSR